MGLDITCKGHKGLYIGYVGFARYRIELLNTYNKSGKLTAIFLQNNISNDECKLWEDICKDKALEKFILHSDCDGKFSYKECKEIYESLEELTPKMEDDWFMEFHLKMIDILKFAYKNRRNVFFC